MNSTISQAIDLHDNCELEIVRFVEYSGSENTDETRTPNSSEAESYQIEPEYKFRVAVESDQRLLLVRAAVLIDFPAGRISADVLGGYRTRTDFPDQLNDHVAREFGRLSAARDLYPYLRTAIQDLSTRLFGNPILLPSDRPFGSLT